MQRHPRAAEPLRVCYFGTYRAGYSRNRIMIAGLRRSGVEVVECQESLWQGFDDRERMASGGWVSPRFWWRVLRTYARLLWRYARLRRSVDVLVVGYPGQVDVLLARVLASLSGKPLVWDVFMSIYLIAVERGLDRRSRLTARLIRALERTACRLPDRLILDTHAYVGWFGAVHGVKAERFRLVPTGADDTIFAPRPRPADPTFCVLYYGTFIPNHGVRYIVEAARLLTDQPDIRFEMVGNGPDREQALALAERYGLRNIHFTAWMEKDALVERIAAADLCLGAFGTTPQSLMTVQNKIYEALAMQRPVLTGDSPAVREALQDGAEIVLCPRADPQALADAISALHADPQRRAALAARGRQRFIQDYDVASIGRLFAAHLRELLGR